MCSELHALIALHCTSSCFSSHWLTANHLFPCHPRRRGVHALAPPLAPLPLQIFPHWHLKWACCYCCCNERSTVTTQRAAAARAGAAGRPWRQRTCRRAVQASSISMRPLARSKQQGCGAPAGCPRQGAHAERGARSEQAAWTKPVCAALAVVCCASSRRAIAPLPSVDATAALCAGPQQRSAAVRLWRGARCDC